jgi:hypothetical protein
MNNYPIPIMAYAFIGITSLVLAYATFLDTPGANGPPNAASATSMLPAVPSMQSLNPFSTGSNTTTSNTSSTVGSMPIAQAVPVSASSALTAINPVVLDKKPTVGGKTKRNKKHARKTKRSRK